MSSVLVFDTWEDTYDKLVFPSFEKNLETRREISDRIKKLDELYLFPNSGLGKGLELRCIVDLSVEGKGYLYEQVQDGLCPTLGHTNYDGYRSIPKLVSEVQKLVQKQDGMYCGAKVTPVFYTINEEKPVVSEEQKQEVKQYMDSEFNNDVKELDEELKEEGVSFMSRLHFKFGSWLLLRDILRCNDTVRGLNEKERNEFERLYFREERK